MGLITIIGGVGLISPFATVQASTYPLQTTFPDIMMYKAHTNKKVIALTFDDGPDQRFTPDILDVLNQHHVNATFFLMGSRVAKYPHVAKRIVKTGHAAGNHTYWHPQLTKTGVHNMKWEINKTEQQIQAATGTKPKLFRAPYGALNKTLVKKLGGMGYKGIGWSIDTNDWKELSARSIVNRVFNNVHPGAIILMHSAGHGTQDLSGTVHALKKMIPRLKKKGYRFVTIPELWSLEHENMSKDLHQ